MVCLPALPANSSLLGEEGSKGALGSLKVGRVEEGGVRWYEPTRARVSPLSVPCNRPLRRPTNIKRP